MSRQSFYQRKDNFFERESYKTLIIEFVRDQRSNMPRIGCFKLYEKARIFFADHLPLGRDAFFSILREHGLMLRIKRTYRARTTDSDHPYGYHQDLLKASGFRPMTPCRLWVSDITYIPLGNGIRKFCYLSLITDAYSRKIVGWQLAETLQYKHTEKALRQAMQQERALGFDLTGMIHHSDRGVQYAYPEYVKLLKQANCLVSMTQTGDPLDNAMAERVNGILKTEWLNMYRFTSIKQVRAVLNKVIYLYNNERPHMGINMRIPNQLHLEKKNKSKSNLDIKKQFNSFVNYK